MKRILLPATIASLGLLTACSDSSAPQSARVSLTIAAPASSPMAAKAAGADTLVDGTNTLVLTGVQIVLRKIEVEATDGAASEADSIRVEEFEAGPLLVDLPLGSGTDQMLNVEIAPGTYDEVEFEIHAVSGGDPAEVAFTDAHPEFVGVSIRAEGTYNGTSFTFETDMDQEQESEINPPLVIDVAGGSVNLTLRIDHTQWFSDGNGGLLDPATANHGGENEGVVEANIESSFTTFEDDDCDGEED